MNVNDAMRRLEALARSHDLDLEALLIAFVGQVERAARRGDVESASMIDDLDAIFNYLIEACLIVNPDGRIRAANASAAVLFGCSQAELETLLLADLGLTLDLDDPTAADGSAVHCRRRDGQPLEVCVRRVLLGPDRIALLIVDRNLQQAIDRLSEVEAAYRDLLENQVDLVCRYRPDTTLTYVNDTYCAHFGKSRAELIGTSFLNLPQVLDPRHVEQRIETILRDPKPETHIVETQTASGEKRWIQWIDYGIRGEDGTVREIQAIGRDVTMLFQLQQALANRENMLSTIFAKIPLMLVVGNTKAHYEYVNSHFTTVTGWTAEEMSAHPDILAQFYPDPAYRQEVMAFVKEATGEWRDFRTRTRSGEVIDTSWANVPLSDGRVLGIGQVITERIELENQRVISRQLELELEKEREIRALRDRYISLVAHELRTPLTLALSAIEGVRNYQARMTPERISEKLSVASQQLTAMGKLIEDALRYAKQQSAHPDYKPLALPLKADCQRIAERILQNHDFSHTITVTGDDGLAWYDPKLLEVVMLNLLHNAIKYSAPRTEIAVQVRADDQMWTVSVSDQGIGIPPDEIGRLFQPFYRASNAQALPGTGFGLSIVEEYVVKMGGKITVTSEIGRGSTFTFTVPAPP